MDQLTHLQSPYEYFITKNSFVFPMNLFGDVKPFGGKKLNSKSIGDVSTSLLESRSDLQIIIMS